MGSLLAALVISPVAAAHGGGGALGFRSQIERVNPKPSGLTVEVVDSDDRLELENKTGKRLVILGYEGEPYLVFRNGGVYRNTRSPATYLNDDRYGQVKIPDQADPKASPVWERVAARERYEWHDHRIHWMSATLPPKVRAAKDKAQNVFKWTVEGTLDGQPLAISGTLDYQPPPGQRFPKILIAPLVVLGVAGAATIWLRRRREANRR